MMTEEGRKMEFTEIWNEAYNLYCDGGKNAMNHYLWEVVEAGDLDAASAEYMVDDIIETANL